MAAPRITALALALVAALLAVPALRHLREQPPPPPPVIRLSFDPPPGSELGSGDDALDAAISHDERQIVFVATRGGTTMLWHRALASERAEPLAGTEGAQGPAWDPSDDRVGFVADGHLKTITLATGSVTDVAEVSSASGLTWLPDGSILFAPDGRGAIRILRNGTASGATTLRPGERAHLFPFSVGTAGDFTYTAVGDTGRRTVRLVFKGEDRELTVTSGHGVIAGEHLLFTRDGVLFAQRVNVDTGALTGRAAPVSASVGVTAAGRGLFAATARVLLTAGSTPRARQLTWFDAHGKRTGTSGDAGDYWQVRLSPDDQHAAVTVLAPLLRTLDIVIVPAATAGDVEPLTLALAADSDPVWSPDGTRVVFRSLQSGRPALFVKRVRDKNANEERLAESDATPTDWRDVGILVHEASGTAGFDIWSLNEKTRQRSAAVSSSFNDLDGRWSPTGDWLAFASDESGRSDVYASHRPDGGRVRVSFAGGTRPRWARDGRSLFFLRGSTIMRSDLQQGQPDRFAPAVPVVDLPGIRDFDLAHRRDAVVALVPTGAGDQTSVSAIVDWQTVLPVAR